MIEDWIFHRVATSGKYADSLVDIKYRWTLSEVYDALDVIDLFECVQAKQAARERDAASRGKPR